MTLAVIVILIGFCIKFIALKLAFDRTRPANHYGHIILMMCAGYVVVVGGVVLAVRFL